MRRWAGALVLAGLLASAPPAAAAIDLGVGDSPAVVVDPAGTAHIVFNSAGGETYCRLPRTAKACDVLTALPLDGRSIRGPLILRRPQDGALFIVQGAGGPGTGAVWVRYSVDGGTTWIGPVAVASGSSSISGAGFAPDGQSLFTLDPGAPGGLTLQRGLFGAPESRGLVLEPSGPNTYGESSDARLAVLPDGRLLIADETHTGVHWRFFAGGDPYDINAWAREGRIRAGTGPELATGPRGTYLLEKMLPLHQDRGAFRVRSFDAKRARWRAPRRAVGDRVIRGDSGFIQDAGGRLHLVTDTLITSRVGCVIYTRTSRKRSSWFGRSTTLYRTTRPARFPEDVQVGAAANGRGVAVWQDADAARSGGHVRAIRLRQAGGHARRTRSEFFRPSCPRT
jgi:hypothetical protein